MACLRRLETCFMTKQYSKIWFGLESKSLQTRRCHFEYAHNCVPANPRYPIAKYGGRRTVTMLPGGGIGPELMGHIKEVFRVVGVPVDFEEITSEIADDLHEIKLSIERNRVAIKNNIEPKALDYETFSRDATLRKELDLFVYVVRCTSFPGIVTRHKDVDVVLIRQNTEGEYSMCEHETVPGVIQSLKIVSEENTRRLATYAFEYARKHGRKKVTTVHKANIMKISDGTFLRVSQEIAKQYSDIKHNDIIIDNCCMQLVSNPHQFDVLLLTNLYGSIVANMLCGFVGGPGLISGINYGPHFAMFEPGTRNVATAITGKNVANPIAMLNASVALLEHLGHTYYAKLIADAICKTVNEDCVHTPDLNGEASTSDVVMNVINRILEAMNKGQDKRNVPGKIQCPDIV